VLQTTDSSAAINQYILTTAVPQLFNATLQVNNVTATANQTYLVTQTAAEINATSKLT
jgi:hypothetical protein